MELRKFPVANRRYAQRERLKRELLLNNSGVSREVVLLEAETHEALERTHRRYFKTAEQLVECDVTEQQAG